MRLQFLGSGGAFCDFRINYQNNAVVETGEGPVLIDCGVTALQSLVELGISPHDVAAVLVTHVHADHASPEGLIGARYYWPREGDGDPSFLSTRLAAPPDVLDPLVASIGPYVDEFLDRDGLIKSGGIRALVRPEPAMRVEIGGVDFRWFKVPHVVGRGVDKPAYGLEARDGTSRIFWSGDTVFNRAWIEQVAGQSDVDQIFHECTFTTQRPGTVHTHWPELTSLPPEVQRRIVLMHHTAVPDDVDLGDIHGAAARHQAFAFGK